MEGLRERDGSGMGTGTGTPFRDKPPRLSRKGGLSSLLYQPFYEIVLIVFFIFFLACNRTQSKKKRKGDYMKHVYLCKIN